MSSESVNIWVITDVKSEDKESQEVLEMYSGDDAIWKVLQREDISKEESIKSREGSNIYKEFDKHGEKCGVNQIGDDIQDSFQVKGTTKIEGMQKKHLNEKIKANISKS